MKGLPDDRLGAGRRTWGGLTREEREIVLERAPEHVREALLRQWRGAPGYESDQSGRAGQEPGLSGREGAAEDPRRSSLRRMSLPDGRKLPDERPDVSGSGRSGEGGDRPAGNRFLDWATRTVGRRIATVGASLAIIGTLTGLGPEDHLYKPWRSLAARTAAISQQVGGVYQQVGGAVERAVDGAVDQICAAERRSTSDAHLDTLLDSVLITPGVPPGVPFEERIGHVDDPRIKVEMESIDFVLGGRIEWPDVHVVDSLPGHLQKDLVIGAYVYPPGGDGGHGGPAGGAGASGFDAGRSPGEVYGILLDKSFVDREFDEGRPVNQSVRSLLVHELQHAVSADNADALVAAAERDGWPYDPPDAPFSQGRADLAQLVVQEMTARYFAVPKARFTTVERDEDGSLTTQRSVTAERGPRLNELSAEDRRVVLREVLTQFVTPIDEPAREHADDRLLAALRDDSYLHDRDGLARGLIGDPEVVRYADGVEPYHLDATPYVTLVPKGMDESERFRELMTPLDELAQEWREERAGRVETHAEWLRQRAGAPPAGGSEDRSDASPPQRRAAGLEPGGGAEGAAARPRPGESAGPVRQGDAGARPGAPPPRPACAGAAEVPLSFGGQGAPEPPAGPAPASHAREDRSVASPSQSRAVGSALGGGADGAVARVRLGGSPAHVRREDAGARSGAPAHAPRGAGEGQVSLSFGGHGAPEPPAAPAPASHAHLAHERSRDRVGGPQR